MAEESVSLSEIALSMARLDERVQGLDKRLEDAVSSVRLLGEMLNKRIDDVQGRMDGVQGEIRSMRSWMFVMYGPIVAGVVAVLVSYAKSIWLTG